MKMKYVTKIQGNIHRHQNIRTSRKTDRVLDGTYKSVLKGRSMNFDELREYVPGDNIKDMDWKASSRSQKLLVRQYIAEKKHNIMLVLDTNMRMLGDSAGGEEKRELAIMAAGTLGYYVDRNGDYLSATFCSGNAVRHLPFMTGLANIENILETYEREVKQENTAEIDQALEYITRHFKRRMIMLVVTDLLGMSRISEQNLKRLLVFHDVLMIQVSDTQFGGEDRYGMQMSRYVPSFLTRNRRLADQVKLRQEKMAEENAERFRRLGISCVTIDKTEELDRKIMELLER